MPPKQKTPAPIDRPLSKAYVRQFTGWSTAEPPGLADPTSFRKMENILINRDGSAGIRPGLKYLSYDIAPYSFQPRADVNAIVVGQTDVSASYAAPTTAIAYPAGTQEGDLCVLTLCGGYGVNPTCPDSRMEFAGAGSPWGRGHGVWVGYASDLTTALSITVQGNYNATGQFAIGKLIVFRDSSGIPMEYVIDPAAVVNLDDTTSPMTLATGEELSGQILSFAAAGGIGGVYGSQDWGKAPDYSYVGEYNQSYVEIDIGLATSVPAAANTTVNTTAGYGWTSVSIGYRGQGDLAYPWGDAGTAYDAQFVGTHEPFYLNDGTKAYLVAVREDDGTVGFRAMVFDANYSTMFDLTHPDIDFEINQPPEVLNFSSDTTYVRYLQIDNKIFALSNAGETMRIFNVGEHKEAKALFEIERPEWDNDDKLTVVQPEATWIQAPSGRRRNRVPNPSFERNLLDWHKGPLTGMARNTDVYPGYRGQRNARIYSMPTRVNYCSSPLYDVPATGYHGWGFGPGEELGLSQNGSYIEITTHKDGFFFAKSSMMHGLEPSDRYKVAFDYIEGAHCNLRVRLQWFGNNGSQIGPTTEDLAMSYSGGRATSPGIRSPKNAVSARVLIGGKNTGSPNSTTSVQFKNVVVCQADEPTTFFSGNSGANYYWVGNPNGSASLYHPPANISVHTSRMPARPAKKIAASIYARAGSTTKDHTLTVSFFNKHDQEVGTPITLTSSVTAAAWLRLSTTSAGIPANATQARIAVSVPLVARGENHYLDAALLECNTDVVGDYFDGSTTDTGTQLYDWLGKKHRSASRERTYASAGSIPTAATRTPDTLIASGGATKNPYSFAFFYTFENEVGESAASKITVRRAQRAWSDWVWETPNAASEPSGTNTDDPNMAADQLVAYMPQDVWDEAMAQGATKWNLYMFTWSDQDVVPVTAFRVGQRELTDESIYTMHGWIRVTPAATDATDSIFLPTETNRINYSKPSSGGQGLVAGDRLIVVDDPNDPGVIRWSSNLVGEYTNFTASKGGGYKTLTSGNLNVPASVKLWQNPQSADTICILCLGTDGYSSSYYMAPATVSAQSEATNVMGFEETTATPGTTSPYGVEIFNNSLYHPLDDQLMKSTASNYNINHKSQSDLIRNMWEKLKTKQGIISSQHDGRLYYIVNNPEGEQLQEGCNGNEIWVYDATSKTGTWSRFLIQAHSLRKIEFGNQIYMSVTRPEGIYYFDHLAGLDEYVDEVLFPGTKVVQSRAIPWALETNTQGANRAHDAWAHVQMLQVTFGNFLGRCRYGLRSNDTQGRIVNVSKIVRDRGEPDTLMWDINDQLQVKRDIMEWYFYAESLVDDEGVVEPSQGQISAIQFRYAPVTVNVGYGLGSVETFQYGRDVAEIAPSTTENGIPLPLLDSRRP